MFDNENDPISKEDWPSKPEQRKNKPHLKVPSVPLDDISFHSVNNAQIWQYILNCKIDVEKELFEQVQDYLEIMGLSIKLELVKYVLNLDSYYP